MSPQRHPQIFLCSAAEEIAQLLVDFSPFLCDSYFTVIFAPVVILVSLTCRISSTASRFFFRWITFIDIISYH